MSALLIFDCDGVLVDSELLEHAVDAELLRPFGCNASADQLLQRFVGIARREMYEVVFGELKREIPAGLLEERERRVWARCVSDLQRVPGVEPALEALTDFGKCVASSSLPDKLRMKLESTGLVDHFTPHIFSTALVARGKPAPDIYLLAARATGHPPEACIVIEDSRHGIAGARAAAMRTVGFAGGSHAKEGLRQELLDAGATVAISHMRDLPRAIRPCVTLKSKATDQRNVFGAEAVSLELKRQEAEHATHTHTDCCGGRGPRPVVGGIVCTVGGIVCTNAGLSDGAFGCGRQSIEDSPPLAR